MVSFVLSANVMLISGCVNENLIIEAVQVFATILRMIYNIKRNKFTDEGG